MLQSKKTQYQSMNKRKKNPGQRARSFINRHGVISILILLSLMILLFWTTRERARIYFRRCPVPLPASPTSVRRLVGTDFAVFQAMHGLAYPDAKTTSYKVHLEKDARVQVGIIPTQHTYDYPDEFTFTVYLVSGKQNRKLVEKSGKFPVDSWNLFTIDKNPETTQDGSVEILYTIRPRGIKNKLTSLVTWVKGINYYKDFVFLEPTVLYDREAGKNNLIICSFDPMRFDHMSCAGYSRATTPHTSTLLRNAVFSLPTRSIHMP
jgi:hypothetical protein